MFSLYDPDHATGTPGAGVGRKSLPMMTLAQLRTFCTVARLNSFSKAAEELRDAFLARVAEGFELYRDDDADGIADPGELLLGRGE